MLENVSSIAGTVFQSQYEKIGSFPGKFLNSLSMDFEEPLVQNLHVYLVQAV